MVEAIKAVLDDEESLHKIIKLSFDKIDSDNFGYIDFKIVETIILRLSTDMGVEPPKSQDIEEVFKESDKDNDGVINFDEFYSLIKDILQGLIKSENDDEDINENEKENENEI